MGVNMCMLLLFFVYVVDDLIVNVVYSEIMDVVCKCVKVLVDFVCLFMGGYGFVMGWFGMVSIIWSKFFE